MSKSNLRQNITELRKSTGMAQEDFSDKMDICLSSITHGEEKSGKQKLSQPNVDKYVETFCISEGDLRYGDLSGLSSFSDYRKLISQTIEEIEKSDLFDQCILKFLSLKTNKKIKNKMFLEAYELVQSSDIDFITSCTVAKYKFFNCYKKTRNINCLYNFIILFIIEWCVRFTPTDFNKDDCFIVVRRKIINFRKENKQQQIEYFNKNYEKLSYCINEIQKVDSDFVDFYLFLMNTFEIFKCVGFLSYSEIFSQTKASFIMMLIRKNKYLLELCNLIY